MQIHFIILLVLKNSGWLVGWLVGWFAVGFFWGFCLCLFFAQYIYGFPFGPIAKALQAWDPCSV